MLLSKFVSLLYLHSLLSEAQVLLRVQAIALQTRHILDEMNAHGYDVQGIYMSGKIGTNLIVLLSYSSRT